MVVASATPTTTSRPLLLSSAWGVAGGILGLLPWLLGGGRLPLQNLWEMQTMPEEMPFVLLPVSQYYAIRLFSLVLLGGVFAGLAVRIAGRRRALNAWPGALGVLLVHLVAVVQSFAVVRGGLRGDTDAVLYLLGMLGGAIAAVLLAQVGFWMTSRRSDGMAAFAVALAAVPFTTWVATFVIAFTGEAFSLPFVSEVLRWMPAVIVGAALIWCGVRPAWRIVVWPVSLLTLWVLPALFTAMMYSLGSRVMMRNPAEAASASMQIFPLVLAEGWMIPVAAAVIAVVGTLVRVPIEHAMRAQA